MKNESRPAFAGGAQAAVKIDVAPARKDFRLLLRQTGPHREIGLGQKQRFAVIARFCRHLVHDAPSNKPLAPRKGPRRRAHLGQVGTARLDMALKPQPLTRERTFLWTIFPPDTRRRTRLSSATRSRSRAAAPCGLRLAKPRPSASSCCYSATFLYLGRAILLPIVLAATVALTLAPLVKFGKRHGVSPWITALLDRPLRPRTPGLGDNGDGRSSQRVDRPRPGNLVEHQGEARRARSAARGGPSATDRAARRTDGVRHINPQCRLACGRFRHAGSR